MKRTWLFRGSRGRSVRGLARVQRRGGSSRCHLRRRIRVGIRGEVLGDAARERRGFLGGQGGKGFIELHVRRGLLFRRRGAAVPFSTPLHQGLMAVHAEDALGGAGIAQVFDLSFAVSAAKTLRAEGLLPGQDGQVLDLVPARTTAVGTVTADEGAISEKEQVCVGVEKGATGAAAEAFDMPAITRYRKK